MESMKRFVEERKQTIREETAKLRVEYDAVITYLNSVMQKAETNCQELADELDYDRFRKKCVPSLNWLQEQYDVILLMRSFCLPASCELVVESKSACCLDLPEANHEQPNEMKEHGDEASVYESVVSDLSDLKRKPCSVSSHLATGPNLPVDLVSPAPNLTAENSVRSTADSLAGPMLSETVKKKGSLEINHAIPKYKISEETMEVMATWISSPFMIWVQVKPYACELEDLLEELTDYHSKLKPEDPDYRLCSKPRVGQLVSAQFTQDDMWYRAYVIAVFERPAKTGLPGRKRIEMDVGYVDYGNTERLPLSRVRPLPKKFHLLPFQAFICSLSKIGPAEPAGHLMWSEEVRENFNKMDCTQLLTVRFSKPLPGCPIMFIDVLNSKALGNSKDGKDSTENLLTEKMIRDGQAVRMPDNKHVAKWYSEIYSKIMQPANPGERMVASLTQADIHHAHMPIVDVGMFRIVEFHGSQAGQSFSTSDKSQRHLNHNQFSSADSSRPRLTKDHIAASPKPDKSRPSLNDCQPLLPKVDKLQPLMNDLQVTSVQNTDGRQPPLNESRASPSKNAIHQPCLNKYPVHLPSDVDKSQSILNGSQVFEHWGSKPETRQKLENYRVSSEFNNGFQKNSYYGAAGEILATSDLPKALFQSQMETINSSHGIIDDSGQRNVSDRDQISSSGNFSSVAQSKSGVQHSVISTNKHEFTSSKNGSDSRGKMDSVAGSHKRVNRKGSRSFFQHSVKGLPCGTSSLDSPEHSGSSCSRPPTSPCSLQEQKFHETKAYVEALASSGWPDEIARKALLQNKDDLGNGYHEDVVISPSKDDLGNGYHEDVVISPSGVAVTGSPLRPESGNVASETELQNDDLKQEWVGVPEQEQAQKLEQNFTQKRDHAETKESGQEQEMTRVMPRLAVPDEGFIRVMMSYVESPSRFWVHLADKNACMIDYIGDELKRYDADLTSLGDTSINQSLASDKVLHDFSVCCARSLMDNELYRAEIVDGYIQPNLSDEQKLEIKAEVFYIDFGNSEWVDANRLLPLPPSLVSIPPLAICCSLDGVEPVLASDESSCHWSQEAVDVFTNLSGFTKGLVGHFPSQVKPGDFFHLSRDHPVKLRLEDPNEVVPVDFSQRLLMLGLARPAEQRQLAKEKPIQKKQREPGTEETRDGMDIWDPMAEDFLSYRNSYKVDIDDPGVATVNYKALDERRICRFFHSKNSRCWKGDDCPYEHISFGGVVTTTDRREVFCVCDDELQLELPSVGSWVIVNVTCVIDPSHFFVVLPFGTRSPAETSFEEVKLSSSSQLDEGYDDQIRSPSSNSKDSLEYLMNCLQECYRSKVFIDNDLTVYAEGEIVVVRFTQDERWHRAKVLASDPDNNRIQVLYVDFGNKEWVDNERVRQIEMDFLYLPFQAVECRLPLCANNASGRIWSEMAKKQFLDLIRAQFLVARVAQRGPGGLLYVELYNTRDGEINVNEVLLAKGYARKPDRVLIPRSQHHKTALPNQGIGSTFKDKWFLLPG